MSAHGARDIRKSINIKADIIFISPVFDTTSHKEKKSLGVIKLGLMAKLYKKPVIALGGINNNNISLLKGLPIFGCAGIDVFNEL
jgi:thiamine-phosphate pyrophosphorylase